MHPREVLTVGEALGKNGILGCFTLQTLAALDPASSDDIIQSLPDDERLRVQERLTEYCGDKDICRLFGITCWNSEPREAVMRARFAALLDVHYGIVPSALRNE